MKATWEEKLWYLNVFLRISVDAKKNFREKQLGRQSWPFTTAPLGQITRWSYRESENPTGALRHRASPLLRIGAMVRCDAAVNMIISSGIGSVVPIGTARSLMFYAAYENGAMVRLWVWGDSECDNMVGWNDWRSSIVKILCTKMASLRLDTTMLS